MFMAKFDYAGYIKLTFILLFPFIYLRSSIYVFIYFFGEGGGGVIKKCSVRLEGGV